MTAPGVPLGARTGAGAGTGATDPGDGAIIGVGVWTPGSDDATNWSRAGAAGGGASNESSARPRGPARARRRASLLTQMVADVAVQATEQGGVSLSDVLVVMGSAFGEMATTLDMLNDLESGGDVSPTRFHNSVHNNAAAQLSMGHDNRGFSTSLAAGHETVAMVLLESLMLLRDRGGQVLAIVADESLPAALLHGSATPALAVALLLSADPGNRPPRGQSLGPLGPLGPLGWIGDLRQDIDPIPGTVRPPAGTSPCAAILPLIAAIAFGKRPGRFDLTPGGASHWSIGFAPAAGPALAPALAPAPLSPSKEGAAP